MTYKELMIVSFTLMAFGWAFIILARRPDLALCFLFAALGGFIWAEIKKPRSGGPLRPA